MNGITITPVPGKNIEECGALLRDREVDVVLIERPQAQHYLKSQVWAVAERIVSWPMAEQLYMPVFPQYAARRNLTTTSGEHYVDAINACIMDYVNSPGHMRAEEDWFGATLDTPGEDYVRLAQCARSPGICARCMQSLTLCTLTPGPYAR